MSKYVLKVIFLDIFKSKFSLKSRSICLNNFYLLMGTLLHLAHQMKDIPWERKVGLNIDSKPSSSACASRVQAY